ncbi:MAG: hypothetical protein ACOX3T_07900 [Bdellovibrionota bacterium]
MNFFPSIYDKVYNEIYSKEIYSRKPLETIKRFSSFLSNFFLFLFIFLFIIIFSNSPCFASAPILDSVILDSVKQVASNGSTTCAISVSGELYCWG